MRSGRFRGWLASALLGLVMLWHGMVLAQDRTDAIQTKTFKDADGEHRYGLFLPKDYSAEKKWPVMLFLHGAGERGTDGVAQTKVGIGPVLQKRQATFPFIVVMPQCEDVQARYLTGWLPETKDAQRALNILDAIEKEYSVDTSKRVLTGWSMGGYGTWAIASATPQKWSAVVPLAGGGDAKWASSLSGLSIWAFHGSNDAAIRPDQSRAIISAVRQVGGTPRLTEVTDGEHDINPVVFDNDVLINWMLTPKTTEPVSLTLRATPSTTSAVTQTPFIPAVEINRAVTLRLGNDMLDALSMSLHEQIPKEALQGGIGDIYDSTVVEGRNFSITFGSIAYAATVSRVRLKAYRQDRVNIAVGIKDAVLRIGGTSVVGRDHSASAGAIDIVIGHREPVWLSVDVTPYFEGQKLKLKVAAARFDIPYDNWYVTAPAGVSVRGFGMTSEKVSNGLVSGLYGSKARIEGEVLAIVPKLVAELESKLSMTEADQIVQAFWPLPVYRPRLKVRPEDVSVDANGVSVVLGLLASSLDDKQPVGGLKRVSISDTKASELGSDVDLGVGVAPNILNPLTQMMIDAKVARIHVLDIPEPTFAKFIDREAMTEIFPELKRFGDGLLIWSELSLAKPISVKDGAKPEEMAFAMPEMRISVSIKPTKDAAQWQPFAELPILLEQSTVPQLVKVDRYTRLFQLQWSGAPVIKVEPRFAEGYDAQNKTINNEPLVKLADTAWRGWIGHGPAAQTPVSDISVGISKLRLNKLEWKAPMMKIAFTAPGVKLTNSSQEPFTYETKGPFSGWGGPYTLEPGKSHEYPIAFPLTYRQKVGDQLVVYTLDPGSHSEFRVPQSGGKPQLFQAREELRSGDER